MINYKVNLTLLKEGLLIGEIFFLLLRLISQVLTNLPSALVIVQLVISGLIYRRPNCSHEAQVVS